MSLPSPRAVFRAAAVAEMATWALLILAMVLKYSGATEALMPLGGGLHGFVFLCYVVVVVAVWIDAHWSPARGLLALASSAVPFATVPFERAMERRGTPASRWQVLEPGRAGLTPPERGLRVVLARPLLSVVVTAVGVVVVFMVLLQAGPPTRWGA